MWKILRDVFTLQLLFILHCCAPTPTNSADSEWEATFYEGDWQTRRSLKVTSSSLHGCVNLSKRQLCDSDSPSSSSCTNLTESAKSIDTHGSCVRLFGGGSCEGQPLIELRPGTVCHGYWENCGIDGRIGSVGGCPSVDKHFDQHTSGIIPSVSLSETNITSKNYPGEYESNETVNWIITAPNGWKVQINFQDFAIEEEADCEFDNVTVHELVTNDVIYFECGTKLPPQLVSESNQVRINFRSDDTVRNKGFLLDWKRCKTCVPSPKPLPAGVVPAAIKMIDMDNFTVYDPSILAQDIPDINFITFKKSNPSQGMYGRNVSFENQKKVVIYVHGYATRDLGDGREIKDAIFKGTDDVDSVTLLDWRLWSLPYPDSSEAWPPNYKLVVLSNLRAVYGELEEFILRKLSRQNEIYLIGFSLGAHIAGTAARRITAQNGWVINRISALNPAGPIFEYPLYGLYPVNTTNTLRKTDAKFVDVIHASSVLGMNREAGDLDVFIHEWECTLPPCLHQRAVQLYISSLIHCSLITCPVNLVYLGRNWYHDEYMCDTKNASKISSLGYLADRYEGRGKHDVYLYYIRKSIHGSTIMSSGNCSTYLDLPLPAKKRVCQSLPNDDLSSENCRGKPYLTQCKLSCPNGPRYAACTSKGMGMGSSLTAQAEEDEPGTSWSGSSNCAVKESSRNEEGEAVDFFIIYKLKGSYDYMLITPKADGSLNPIRRSRVQITDKHSILGRTLNPIFRRSDNPISYFMWNDQADEVTVVDTDYDEDDDNDDNDDVEPLSSTGHSKGVLGFNSNSGFFLLHSIPHFPPINKDEYFYPETGRKNAQVAICVSLQTDVTRLLTTLAQQMEGFKPNVYKDKVEEEINEGLKAAISNLKNRKRKRKPTVPERNRIRLGVTGPAFSIHTSGRTKAYDSDMFEHLGYQYGVSMLAQTWPDRSGNEDNSLPSFCSTPARPREHTVENVESILIDGVGIARTSDHSKWGISKDPNKPLTCIGDLNRAKPTMRRGGMFVCTEDRGIHQIFSGFPNVIEAC